MIVFSLLLILVAVGLLVLGLTGGSSGLLIASIVTSLLAAISLVIGARRAAAARRTADPTSARPALFTEEPVAGDVYTEEPALAGEVFTEESAPAGAEPAMAGYDSRTAEPVGAGYESRTAEPAGYESRHAGFEGVAGPDHAEAAAFAAGARDTDEAFRPAADLDEARLREPIWADEPDDDPTPRGADVPAQGAAGGFLAADDAELSGGLGEPDPEDPADEPRPQVVRPADAVRIAQMQDEVVVVDGRPRYHLADCPTLADRETEPLPVAEAVALGFNPCGRCRPVDRLVAAAARR